VLVIWRGFGWLIPVVLFGTILLSQMALDSIYGAGFYKANAWPKIAAITVSSLFIALLGYLLNYKKRPIVVDTESGKKTKSPAHSLFFIPIEVWAVIIPVFFLWAHNLTAKKDSKELFFIESPAVNDIYAVDFTEIFTDTDQKFKYGTLKVMYVKPSGVDVLASEIAYDGKSGVRKDVRKGKANTLEYYSGDTFFLPKEYVKELKSRDGIFQVFRQ
jgi:hypothetical protein